MQIEWNSVFVPSLGIAEIVIRGTLMYLGLFVILRFMGRRQAGHFGPADLLVIVLIADAAQNGLGKEYQSVTEGLVLVMTIVAWEYLIDWLTYRFPALRPVLRPPSLTLVKEGRIVEEAMRKEMLSIDDLASQLRQQQVEDIAEVKLAKLEGDGRLSVLRREVPASQYFSGNVESEFSRRDGMSFLNSSQSEGYARARANFRGCHCSWLTARAFANAVGGKYLRSGSKPHHPQKVQTREILPAFLMSGGILEFCHCGRGP